MKLTEKQIQSIDWGSAGWIMPDEVWVHTYTGSDGLPSYREVFVKVFPSRLDGKSVVSKLTGSPAACRLADQICHAVFGDGVATRS